MQFFVIFFENIIAFLGHWSTKISSSLTQKFPERKRANHLRATEFEVSSSPQATQAFS